METELRRSPRLPFIASAQITAMDTDVRINARTADLSRHGCYMDMVNPLPQGTPVTIAIVHGEHTLNATAAVIYSQTPLGMGLEFRNLDPSEQAKLEYWLSLPV